MKNCKKFAKNVNLKTEKSKIKVSYIYSYVVEIRVLSLKIIVDKKISKSHRHPYIVIKTNDFRHFRIIFIAECCRVIIFTGIYEINLSKNCGLYRAHGQNVAILFRIRCNVKKFAVYIFLIFLRAV